MEIWSDHRMLRIIAVAVMSAALFMNPTGNARESCAGLTWPLDGPVARSFAPAGRYAGHWGVDWAVSEGSELRAAGPGTVSFAGTVVDNVTVTVDHGGGLRSSYSYLATVAVKPGQEVTESTTLGTSGIAHGVPALHFSVRLGATYLDPLSVLGCRLSSPSRALRLVPVRETG